MSDDSCTTPPYVDGFAVDCGPVPEPVTTPVLVPVPGHPGVLVDANVGANKVMPAPKLTPPKNGPCSPWVTCDEVKACCANASTVPDDKLETAILYASELLYNLSGRQYQGICERTIRPACSEGCNLSCSCNVMYNGVSATCGPFRADYPNRAMLGLTCSGCGSSGSCGCGDGCADLSCATLRLPAPIAGIKSVVINGTPLDDSSYIVSGYRELIRVDGKCWPCENDFRRDPMKLWPPKPIVCALPEKKTQLLPGKPDWVNEYLVGTKWYYQPPPKKKDCRFCQDKYDPADIPSWATEFMSSLVCDDNTCKLKNTPCEDCAPWVNEYLIENNITILKGKCRACCDANGSRHNHCGARWVCDPAPPTTFKACCLESANKCCDPNYDGPSSWAANCCQRGGCGCSSHTVAAPQGVSSFSCLDMCPTSLVQCTPDWAVRYMEDNDLPVPDPHFANFYDPGQSCSPMLPSGSSCLPQWIQEYIVDNNITNQVMIGKCLTCQDSNGSYVNPGSGAHYICDCFPTGPDCYLETVERVLVAPCCIQTANPCCDPQYDGSPISGNNCCRADGCDCTPFIVIEQVLVCPDCDAPAWTGPVPPCADGSPAPCPDWSDWIREYFGFSPRPDTTPDPSTKFPDWVNDYLEDYHPRKASCSHPQVPHCGSGGVIEIATCKTPWSANFLRDHEDECGNTYVITDEVVPVVPIVNTGVVRLPDTECFTDADHLGEHVGKVCDSWQVTYYQGREIPWGGKLAASVLACEIALASCGSNNCRLPHNISYLVRQDVSVSFTPLNKLLSEGRLGLYEVDMWINSVNPAKLRRRGHAYDPQKMRHRSRVIS